MQAYGFDSRVSVVGGSTGWRVRHPYNESNGYQANLVEALC